MERAERSSPRRAPHHRSPHGRATASDACWAARVHMPATTRGAHAATCTPRASIPKSRASACLTQPRSRTRSARRPLASPSGRRGGGRRTQGTRRHHLPRHAGRCWRGGDRVGRRGARRPHRTRGGRHRPCRPAHHLGQGPPPHTDRAHRRVGPRGKTTAPVDRPRDRALAKRPRGQHPNASRTRDTAQF